MQHLPVPLPLSGSVRLLVLYSFSIAFVQLMAAWSLTAAAVSEADNNTERLGGACMRRGWRGHGCVGEYRPGPSTQLILRARAAADSCKSAEAERF